MKLRERLIISSVAQASVLGPVIFLLDSGLNNGAQSSLSKFAEFPTVGRAAETPAGDSAPTRASTSWRNGLMEPPEAQPRAEQSAPAEEVQPQHTPWKAALQSRISAGPGGCDWQRREGIWANAEGCSPPPGGFCATESLWMGGLLGVSLRALCCHHS